MSVESTQQVTNPWGSQMWLAFCKVGVASYPIVEPQPLERVWVNLPV